MAQVIEEVAADELNREDGHVKTCMGKNRHPNGPCLSGLPLVLSGITVTPLLLASCCVQLFRPAAATAMGEKRIKGRQYSGSVFPTWIDYMKAVLDGRPKAMLDRQDGNWVDRLVDKKNTWHIPAARPGQANTNVLELFMQGGEPQRDMNHYTDALTILEKPEPITPSNRNPFSN